VSALAALLVGSAVPVPAPLEDFEAALSRHDSATRALEDWCAARGIASPARITAVKGAATQGVEPADLFERLAIGPEDALGLRNVRLNCGELTLSIAWNWFVPGRMPADMVEALHTTDLPFGKIASPLGFRRITLEAMPGRAMPCPDGTISTHRALLVLPDERPLAYVLECYTEANLTAGGPPAAP